MNMVMSLGFHTDGEFLDETTFLKEDPAQLSHILVYHTNIHSVRGTTLMTALTKGNHYNS
jgi:hypothetical protein